MTQRIASVLLLLSGLLPALWVMGLSVADGARIVAGLLLVTLLIGGRRVYSSVRFKPWQRYLLALVLILFVPLTFLHLIAKWSLAQVGLDFVLFVQSIASIGQEGVPYTSFIALGWHNFLSHHLDLMLYLPGAWAALGMYPGWAAISSHALALGLTIALLWLLLPKMGVSKDQRIWLLAWLAILPVFRHALLWSIHDEIYALPLMTLAWFAWRKNHAKSLLLWLFLLGLVKESMALWVVSFSMMIGLESLRFDSKTNHGVRKAAIIIGPAALLWFAGYVWLQPWIFGKSFDHLDKISSIHELFDLKIIGEKLWFFFLTLWPFAMILGKRIHIKDSILVLPALPFFAMIAVSHFAEMWKPLNYYGIIPSFSLLLATIDCAARAAPDDQRHSDFRYALTIALCFATGSNRPIKPIVAWIQSGDIASPRIDFLDPNLFVAATPSAAKTLLNDPHTIARPEFFSSQGPWPGLIVYKKGEESELKPELLAQSQACPGPIQEPWILRCFPPEGAMHANRAKGSGSVRKTFF